MRGLNSSSGFRVAVRSAAPPHHDAVGGERVGDVVLRAERVFGSTGTAPLRAGGS